MKNVKRDVLVKTLKRKQKSVKTSTAATIEGILPEEKIAEDTVNPTGPKDPGKPRP